MAKTAALWAALTMSVPGAQPGPPKRATLGVSPVLRTGTALPCRSWYARDVRLGIRNSTTSPFTRHPQHGGATNGVRVPRVITTIGRMFWMVGGDVSCGPEDR